MLGLGKLLTIKFLSGVALSGQDLSSVLAAAMKRYTSHLTNHITVLLITKCAIYSHKIRVDGIAGGVFKELVHEMSGLICAPRLSEICWA